MNARDFQDLFLEAQATAQAIVRELLEEWQEPLLKTQIAIFWSAMSPEEKEQFRQEHPDDYEKFVEFVQ